MQEFPKNNSKSRTHQAFDILNKTNNLVNQILQDFNADNTPYKKISDFFEGIRDDINDAKERSIQETIRIGILGGTGSGKSTLANALIGDAILPDSAIVFCTSIPTTIKFSHYYSLEVESELQTFNYKERNIQSSEMKTILRSICKESENQNNHKKITKIIIGAPTGILDGKEIVDVPGFTKGNPLHQAFAERYTRYYCDVCLVLINNSGSVEINSRGGLEALADTFRNRLESIAFIINKCDESSDIDITFVERQLQKYLKGEKLHIFRVSSKNSLARNGNEYQQREMIDYLAFLSSRKTIVLVKSLLERLNANFILLKELCRLSAQELDELYRNIKTLNNEFRHSSSQLYNNLFKDKVYLSEIPEIDITSFNLPSPLGISVARIC